MRCKPFYTVNGTHTHTHTPVDPAHCLRTLPLHWDHYHHSAKDTHSTACSSKKSYNSAGFIFSLLHILSNCSFHVQLMFTSPVLCAFLLARACLLWLRSLAHLSVSLSPMLASTSGKKPDSPRLRANQTFEQVPHHQALGFVRKVKMALRTSPVRRLRSWCAGGLCEAQQVRLLQAGNTRPPAHFL